jgi:hypothetical protein
MEERKIARELNSEEEDARSVDFNRLKRRKCARWLVPN